MEVKFLLNKIAKIKKTKKIRCPTCKKVALKLFFPFCSKKCGDIDLMKWLSDTNNNENEYSH